MKRKEDTSALTRVQRFGYWLVRLLGSLQTWAQFRFVGERVWRSADGRCTPISKMSDTHLYNSLRMLQRQKDQSDLERVLRSEYERRRLLHVVVHIGRAAC